MLDVSSGFWLVKYLHLIFLLLGLLGPLVLVNIPVHASLYHGLHQFLYLQAALYFLVLLHIVFNWRELRHLVEKIIERVKKTTKSKKKTTTPKTTKKESTKAKSLETRQKLIEQMLKKKDATAAGVGAKDTPQRTKAEDIEPDKEGQGAP